MVDGSRKLWEPGSRKRGTVQMFFAKVAGLQLQCCALIGLSVPRSICEIVESIGMSALYHREEIAAVIEIKPRGVEGATFWCRNPLWIARFGVFFAGHTDTGGGDEDDSQ